MASVDFTDDGDRRLIARFRAMGPDVRRALLLTAQRQVLLLSRHVKGSKLSGQVLKNRTGHLRASVTGQAAATSSGVEARVGVYQATAARYGRAHEYGYTGTVDVRPHLRGPSKRVAKRLARFARRAEALGFDGTLYRTAGTGIVRGHTRQVSMRERSYLRSSLADRREAILSDMSRVVGQVAAGGRT